MAMTVRLSEQLRLEAGQYSEREGLTVNALIAVALREYLDRRRASATLPGPLAAPVAAPGGVAVGSGGGQEWYGGSGGLGGGNCGAGVGRAGAGKKEKAAT